MLILKSLKKVFICVGSCVSDILAGGKLIKVGRDGNIGERSFKISGDHHYLVWYTNILFSKKIDLTSVLEVRHGQTTSNFEHESTGELAFASDRSFSLICEDRTVDLIALTIEDYQNWYYGLKQIVERQYTVR
jgi:hypothetical protein